MKKITGVLLSDSGHSIKGELDSNGLRNLIENGVLEGGDKNIAT